MILALVIAYYFGIALPNEYKKDIEMQRLKAQENDKVQQEKANLQRCLNQAESAPEQQRAAEEGMCYSLYDGFR